MARLFKYIGYTRGQDGLYRKQVVIYKRGSQHLIEWNHTLVRNEQGKLLKIERSHE